jgi:hypothetical protein
VTAELPKPPRMPPLLKLPGMTEMHILAETRDLRLHLRLGAVADAHGGDDGRDADDHAQRGEHRAHFVAAQGAERDSESVVKRTLMRSVSRTLVSFAAASAEAARVPRDANRTVRHRFVADDHAVAHDDVALAVVKRCRARA